MADDFKQTIDLRRPADRTRKPGSARPTVSPLEKIFEDQAGGRGSSAGFKKINRPERSKSGREFIIVKIIIFIIAIIVIGLTVYFLFLKPRGANDRSSKSEHWYAATLCDGTIYYGQIADVKANPVVLKNAYYDYDQAKAIKEKKSFTETGNIRLVKRGQEIQGGDGSLLLYHDNISLEPLRDDSKVLKAILEYEK